MTTEMLETGNKNYRVFVDHFSLLNVLSNLMMLSNLMVRPHICMFQFVYTMAGIHKRAYADFRLKFITFVLEI